MVKVSNNNFWYMSRKLRVQTVFFFYMWVCIVPKRPDLSDMFITALAVRTVAPPKCCLNTDIQSGEKLDAFK